MNLKNILQGIENIKGKGNFDIEIENIESDSRKVTKNGLFFAIKGFAVDGTDYINSAVENGAIAVVIEDEKDIKKIEKINDITVALVPDIRKAMAISACNFYDNPSKKLRVVGVTGTKGKTTTTFMVKEILEKQGYKVGLIGTIANYIGEVCLGDSSRTTPESIELQKLFARMVEEKCQVAVMEVSSQSLKLDRVYGCDFDIGVFTNFSEDHISEHEHPDMEDYFKSKCKLFDMCKTAFINVDDLYGEKLKKIIPCEFATYGIDNSCNLLAKDITITNSYVDFKVKLTDRNERVKVDIPGRSELVPNKKGLTIMIDYAHSPESLENILSAVKSYTRGKVISVFGCGGDRDTSKRAIMGEISGRIADYTIITSDNPRTEKPELIVEEIESGMKKTNGKYEVVVDRIEAIKTAINMAGKTDIIVLAGKGHEPYQEINGVKYPFDERKIVNDIIG